MVQYITIFVYVTKNSPWLWIMGQNKTLGYIIGQKSLAYNIAKRLLRQSSSILTINSTRTKNWRHSMRFQLPAWSGVTCSRRHCLQCSECQAYNKSKASIAFTRGTINFAYEDISTYFNYFEKIYIVFIKRGFVPLQAIMVYNLQDSQLQHCFTRLKISKIYLQASYRTTSAIKGQDELSLGKESERSKV